MFDNVGRNEDEDAAKRSALTVVIAALFGGAIFAFTIGYGMFMALNPAPPIEIMDDEMVEVAVEDPTMDEAPPPPPPPPPPPAAADEEEEEEEEDEDVKVETDEQVEEIKELEEKVETKVKSVTKPKGVKDGQEDGVEDGQKDGVQDGQKDGVIGGVLNGGGVRIIHKSEITKKSGTPPRYPKAAEDLNMGSHKCRVKVWIDEKGLPYKNLITGCPDVFVEASKKSIMKWKWYPFKEGRTKLKTQTTYVFNFQAR